MVIRDKIGQGEGARPIHQLGSTAPGVLPSGARPLSLETQRRIEEGLLPRIGAWDRSDIPLYLVTGSSIKEGALLKLTKAQNEQQIRISGLFVIYIPFGAIPEGVLHTGQDANATMYAADVLIKAT